MSRWYAFIYFLIYICTWEVIVKGAAEMTQDKNEEMIQSQ